MSIHSVVQNDLKTGTDKGFITGYLEALALMERFAPAFAGCDQGRV